MDCRTCQPTLIDLLHGELATDAAEEAHAHLRECASCRAAFDKLSHGMRLAQRLPVMEPPQAVGARLMQLAEEHVRVAASLRNREAPKSPSAWQSLLDFVGRFAMARQVGMATIMLLIVAVGLWSLPQLQRSRVADGGTIVSPEPPGEVAPSSAMPVPVPPGVLHEVPAEMAAQPAEEPTGSGAELDRTAERVAAQSAGDDFRPAAKGASAGARSARKEKREAEAFPESAPHAESSRARPARSKAKSANTQSSDESEPLAGLGASKSDDLLLSDRLRANAGPPPPAAATAVEVEGEAKSAPVKKSAQAEASPCGPARMRGYQQTVDAAPSSAAAGEALLAMARCHNASGEHALARALLERAARNAHVAGRARTMLGATQRATKPAAAAPAAPSAAPAAVDEAP